MNAPVTAAALLHPIMAGACCDGYGGRGFGGMMTGPGYIFGGLVMMFLWLLFLAAVGALIYAILQGWKTRASGYPVQETPMDILKKRYARGEITKEEYEQTKKDLQA